MNNKSKWVVKFSEVDKENLELIGKNVVNLHTAQQLGFNLPDSFVITTDAYSAFLKENNLISKITDLLTTAHYERPDSLMQVWAHIEKMLLSAKFPKEFQSDINNYCEILFDNFERVTLSSRDAQTIIRDYNKLPSTIKQVWADHFRPQNLIFFNSHNKNLFKDGIPILIQGIIQSKKSGTISTDRFIITGEKINQKQKEELISIAQKLKKHFYFPQIISWAIEKNIIYITNIKLLT